MFFCSLFGLLAVAGWTYLALAPGMFWVPVMPRNDTAPAQWPSVDIVVPARNEADALPKTLPSLLAQDYAGEWRVILVDDHSGDGTSDVAQKIAEEAGKSARLTIIAAPDLAEGWSGKVAAMNAGAAQGTSEMILFTDADILHMPSHLRRLVSRAEAGKLDLVSRMVLLNCATFAEKLLIPAFVFFFAMLYPFRRVNDPQSKVAGAAGGVMLLRRAMLDKIGGMGCIKSALIDDCSLADAVKAVGRIELTLTREAESLRLYPHIEDVQRMVSRTAYTQLKLSPWLLIGTIVAMAVLYAVPPFFFVFAPGWLPFLSAVVCELVMTVLYLPTVRFYGLPWVWALTLPFAALIYGVATLDSARLYYQGRGGQWKGRTQA